MTIEFPHASYERAVREYDDEFCRALSAAIVNTIAETSVITEADFKILMLRVGETLGALTTVMVSFAAMSPQFDVPSNLRTFAENTARRIRREVSRARAEGGLGRDFIIGAQRDGGTA
jgi:hypothetical protein